MSLLALAAARLNSQASATVVMAVSDALRRTDAVPDDALLRPSLVGSSDIGTVERLVVDCRASCILVGGVGVYIIR